MFQVRSNTCDTAPPAAGSRHRAPSRWRTVTAGTRVGRRVLAALCLPLCLALLAACSIPGSVKPTVKIGLSAPFEGLHRDLGYSVLHAVRLAVRQRNEAGGIADRLLVELVALNDFNEGEEAIRQAAEMAVDPDILGVVGGWTPATAQAAAPEYERLGIAFLAPIADWNGLGRVAARVADEQLAAHRAVVLRTDSPEDLAFVAAFAEEFAARGGEIVAQGEPTTGASLEQLLALPDETPPVIVLSGGARAVAGWLTEARQIAPGVPVLGGPVLGDPLVSVRCGEAAEGVSFVSHLAPPSEDPAFVGGFEALSGGVRPNLVAGWAFAAANSMLDALESAAQTEGWPTRSGVELVLEGQTAVGPAITLYRVVDGAAKPVAEY